jgi:hypothetical protein
MNRNNYENHCQKMKKPKGRLDANAHWNLKKEGGARNLRKAHLMSPQSSKLNQPANCGVTFA